MEGVKGLSKADEGGRGRLIQIVTSYNLFNCRGMNNYRSMGGEQRKGQRRM